MTRKHNLPNKGLRESNPSRRSIHTAKWDRCFEDVSAKGGARSAAAVCTSMLGERGSIKAGHRRKNPSARGYIITGVGGELRNQVGYKPGGYPVYWTGTEWSDNPKDAKEYLSERTAHLTVTHSYSNKYGSISNFWTRPVEREKLRDKNPTATRVLKRERVSNPSGFQLEKTQRLYFMVHAHPHRGGGERLWLTQSGTLSADKGNGARYTSVEVAVARAKAFLKKHRVARKYRFDVCLSD